MIPPQVFYARQEKNLRPPASASGFSEGEDGAGAGPSSGADEDEDDGGDPTCSGCDRDRDSCCCEVILAEFRGVNTRLIELGALERLAAESLTRIVHSRIDKHVEETCRGNFTSPHLPGLETWLDAVVLGWMRLVYSSEGIGGSKLVEGFRCRLQNHLYETYAKTRIDQLFNIIIEYPDSQPALEDLRACLERTAGDLRGDLTAALRDVLRRKLLHLGVSTTDVLTAYVAAIRSLRVLDPDGVVLELVCEPVRAYLRTRDDTVRCIVQSLIDDNCNELAEELKQNEGKLIV